MANKYVAYCGFYCRLCDNVAVIPPQARALHESLRNAGWDKAGERWLPNFGQFMETLQKIGDGQLTCVGCRGGCGETSCEIRACAQARDVDACPFCPDYEGCEKVATMIKRAPFLATENARMRAIGIESWIVEQEAQLRAGNTYANRCIAPCKR